MRTIIFTAVLALASILIASPVLAEPGNNQSTPAQESVCDPLKADGVTKGLYGLCVAYCEANAQSQDVLDEFNARRTEDDPEIPCGAPPATCPCWTAAMLQAASGSGITPECSFGIGDSVRDEAIYLDFSGFPFTFEAFGIDSSACTYIYDSDLLNGDTIEGDVSLTLGVTPAEEVVCRTEVASLCL